MYMKHKNNGSKMFPTLFFTFIALGIACLAAIYAWVLINNYEKGVAEIYAQEQDGYVQLVLDQIICNLRIRMRKLYKIYWERLILPATGIGRFHTMRHLYS